jgi:hypothetical protein
MQNLSSPYLATANVELRLGIDAFFISYISIIVSSIFLRQALILERTTYNGSCSIKSPSISMATAKG